MDARGPDNSGISEFSGPSGNGLKRHRLAPGTSIHLIAGGGGGEAIRR
jgi:hypothetical protein